MWKTTAVPSWLHEVLGETQTPAEILATVLFGVLVPVVLWFHGANAPTLETWRDVVAWLLVLDVSAGCVANFTRGTNRFYRERPVHRWVFIAVHGHLPAMAWLLGAPLMPALVVWAYTVASAVVVNLLAQSPRQVVVAGVLLAAGLVLAVVTAADVAVAWWPAVACLFVLKVVFAFGVDHHREPEAVAHA